MKKWVLIQGERARAPELAKDLGISTLASAVLLTKGLKSKDQFQRFIGSEKKLTSPWLIRDMELAVERIEQAIEDNERICVFGDYDADGVTSTAMMYLYLKSLWCNVIYYIPDRKSEGYGLNNFAIERLNERGVTLIITVDNGISAYDQVNYANSFGIDTIITDHHTPPKVLPDAVAILDPHRDGDESPFKHFSGVGVAFKLIMALERDALDMEKLLDRFSDICALGTVADIVSLTDENRILVQEGLKRINERRNIGITALCRAAGYENKQIRSGDVAFILAPRINACGRLGTAVRAVELLTTNDERRAEELAQELCRANEERKKIENDICESVIKTLDENENLRNRRIIVVAGEGWHQGVIGLAASKIKELYGKPTVVISYDGGSAKGSARSVEGFPMNEGVTYCSELLTIFGGHPMAAGMSLPTKNIDAFREKINEFAETVSDDFFPAEEISARVKLGGITVADVNSLSILEPFGCGNPKPVFAYGGVKITGVVSLKNGLYTKVFFERDGNKGNAVSFSTAYSDFPYKVGDIVDISVELKVDEFREGEIAPQLREIKFSDSNNVSLLASKQVFEELLCGKPVTDEVRKELSVSRDDFVSVYKYFKGLRTCKAPAEVLYHRTVSESVTFGAFLVILRAMEQLGLILTERCGDMIKITAVKDPPKVDIYSAEIMKVFE